MQVTRAKTRVLRTPADSPLVTDFPTGGATREFVTLELDTDEGIQGIGLTFAPGTSAAPMSATLRAAVDGLCELVIGRDPMAVEAISENIRRSAGGSGPGGIFTLALSAIDTALWDIKGKALDQSVCSLLGGFRDRVPTYASGALVREMNLEYLAEAGPRLVNMGFKQMKTQMGAESTPAKEVDRIRVLRDGIGPDIDLMCDINQLWNVNQAIDVGKRVEEYHLFWLEDVVAHDDYQGLGPCGRRPDHPHRRRRVRLRHPALPPHAGIPLDRHRHDRPVAGRRHHPVEKGGRHGRSLQPAGGKPLGA